MPFAYHLEDTIAAIATPPGEGGVGIIRISGSYALDVAERVFSGPVHSYATHTAHYGSIKDDQGDLIDTALCLVMLGKRSYTGENTVEIHCHGGSLITRRVLEAILKAGARAAQAGEFTFRAFMNRKIDLAQAEAVQELISSKNELAMQAAHNQLQGALSKKIGTFQIQLTDIAAILEAWVDFPEEDLEFASFDEVIADLDQIVSQMQSLHDTFHQGKVLHEGITLSLIGCPNVGKSSLMNALLGKDRAIVSDIPGTTRDILEDDLRLGNVNVRLIDTAGIRETSEIIEIEGIRRSRKAIEEADLILLILDAVKGIEREDQHLLEGVIPEKTIVVWNKIDLNHLPLPKLSFPHAVAISAKHGKGLEELHQMIDKIIWSKGAPSKEEMIITQLRHKEALAESIQACLRVKQGIQGKVSAEFVSFDMRNCLSNLGRIIGTDVTEDILSAIFSKFCVGK